MRAADHNDHNGVNSILPTSNPTPQASMTFSAGRQIIRVYDDAGNEIEAREQEGEFKEP
jgi:hypothetical protein